MTSLKPGFQSEFKRRTYEFLKKVSASEWVKGLKLPKTADGLDKEKTYDAFHSIVTSLLSSSYTPVSATDNLSGGLAVLEKSLGDSASENFQFMVTCFNLCEAISTVVDSVPAPEPVVEAPAPTAESTPTVEPAPKVEPTPEITSTVPGEN